MTTEDKVLNRVRELLPQSDFPRSDKTGFIASGFNKKTANYL